MLTSLKQKQPLLKLLHYAQVRTFKLNAQLSKDPYFILGIQKDTPLRDVKKAYFQLAKKYHPDLNPNNEKAKQTFLQIQQAYRLIQLEKDPAMKIKYQREFNEY